MKSKDRHRLLQQAAQAQAARSATQGHAGTTQQGDVFSLPSTAQLAVLWAWVETVSDGPGEHAVLVAADLNSWVGSADISTPPEAPCGTLSLRCAFEVEVPVESLREASLVGGLPPRAFKAVQQKRLGVKGGSLRGSRSERNTDEDAEYQAWLDAGPRQAQAVLRGGGSPKRGDGSPQRGDLTTDAFSAVPGAPWMLPVAARQIVDRSLQEEVDPGLLQLLQHVHRGSSQPHLGADTEALDQGFRAGGWGLVLPSDAPPETLTALEPLIEHRRRQFGDDRVQVLDHLPGEDWRSWLARHGVAPGHNDISKVPYFLLIVAPPGRISLEFQHVLGVEYGTGRLSFKSEELARYAQGLVTRERRGGPSRARRAVYFEPSTAHSAGGAFDPAEVSFLDDWEVHRLLGEDASREGLLGALQSREGPPVSLWVAVTPGWVDAPGAPRQRELEGALLCHRGSAGETVEAAHRVAASDVGEARIEGSVQVLLAAHSAASPGNPTDDHPGSGPRIAALPQQLLVHPNGGADAVIGRMGPGWRQDGAAPNAWLQDLIEDLTSGRSVGRALQRLRTRYASLATELTAELSKVQLGARHDAARLARLWGERNNLRDLVVLGDPAARLALPGDPASKLESAEDANPTDFDAPLSSDVTVLLEQWSDGDADALDRLIPLVFDELRAMAHNYFRKEASNQTLQTTALVHEVYLRLQGRRTVQWRNRSHFFGSLAAMIRQVLVDRARRRKSAKRGGGVRPLPFDDLQLAVEARDPDLLALDETLEKLKGLSPRQHQVVELKFFMGLTLEEIARVLDVAKSTVIKDWANARAFLLWQLSQDGGTAGADDRASSGQD